MSCKQIIVLAALLPIMACDLDVPDLNNVPESELVDRPTRALVRAAAVGLIIGNRAGYAANNGYISHLGTLGRESYNLSEADPRFVSELLEGAALDPGSPAFGGNFWINPYANIHNANNLLRALDKLERDGSAELTAGELAATRGYAKTMQALDYLVVINTRDVNGAALVTDETVNDLPPLVSKGEIFAHIGDLLAQAREHLEQAGGAGFPFSLPGGFDGFTDPAAFLRFHGAIEARVHVYTGDYEAALDSLAGSFLSVDPAAPRLGLGVYHTYSILPGDALNELVSPTIVAHPSIVADAEPGDQRVSRKIRPLAEQVSRYGLSSSLAFTLYPAPDASAPIIRNEELILLRAEANLMLGNIDEAIADVNFVRVHSGGLAARTDLDASNLEDELLYQRRYGLLFEGHRWIDMRRFGRLDDLPLDGPNHAVHDAFPIPLAETDPRADMGPG